MSKLSEIRSRIDGLCSDLRNELEDAGFVGEEKKFASMVIEELSKDCPSGAMISYHMQLGKLDGFWDDPDDEGDMWISSLAGEISDELYGALEELKIEEAKELQLLQQEAKASSGLPSKALSH